MTGKSVADYKWMIGKTYPGRNPKPQSTFDGRTITVDDVTAGCTITQDGHNHDYRIKVHLSDNTGRRWICGTEFAEAIAQEIRTEQEREG